LFFLQLVVYDQLILGVGWPAGTTILDILALALLTS
jgi:hypothetical protein